MEDRADPVAKSTAPSPVNPASAAADHPVPGWGPGTRLLGAVKTALWRRLWGLDIGPGTRVHPAALLDRTWPVGLHIGSGCWIDAHAVVLAHDFTRGVLADTRIGNNCRIGARALVMPGVTIGDDCRIWPGALVNRDMPPGSTAIGNPAQIEPRFTPDPAAQGARS